jgi:hypothetical protein
LLFALAVDLPAWLTDGAGQPGAASFIKALLTRYHGVLVAPAAPHDLESVCSDTWKWLCEHYMRLLRRIRSWPDPVKVQWQEGDFHGVESLWRAVAVACDAHAHMLVGSIGAQGDRTWHLVTIHRGQLWRAVRGVVGGGPVPEGPHDVTLQQALDATGAGPEGATYPGVGGMLLVKVGANRSTKGLVAEPSRAREAGDGCEVQGHTVRVTDLTGDGTPVSALQNVQKKVARAYVHITWPGTVGTISFGKADWVLGAVFVLKKQHFVVYKNVHHSGAWVLYD